MSCLRKAQAACNNLRLFLRSPKDEMQKLEERVLLARWKSYKAFKHLGEIRLYSTSFYQELHFTEERILILKESNKRRVETSVKQTSGR